MASGSLLEDVLVLGGLAVGGYLLWNYISTLPAATATTTPVATPVTTTPVATTAVATAVPVSSTPTQWAGPPNWAQGYQRGQGGGFAARVNTGGPQVTMRGRPQRFGNRMAQACTFTAADGTKQSGMMISGTCQANMSAG